MLRDILGSRLMNTALKGLILFTFFGFVATQSFTPNNGPVIRLGDNTKYIASTYSYFGAIVLDDKHTFSTTVVELVCVKCDFIRNNTIQIKGKAVLVDLRSKTCNHRCDARYGMYMSKTMRDMGAIAVIFVTERFDKIKIQHQMKNNMVVAFIKNTTEIYSEPSNVTFLPSDSQFVNRYNAFLSVQLAYVSWFSILFGILAILGFSATIIHMWKHVIKRSKDIVRVGDMYLLTLALGFATLFALLRFFIHAIDYGSYQGIIRKNTRDSITSIADIILACVYIFVITYWGQLATFSSQFWTPTYVLRVGIVGIVVFCTITIILFVVGSVTTISRSTAIAGFLSIVATSIFIMFMGIGSFILYRVNKLIQKSSGARKPSELFLRMSVFIAVESTLGAFYVISQALHIFVKYGTVKGFELKYWIWGTLEVFLIFFVILFLGFPDLVWYYRRNKTKPLGPSKVDRPKSKSSSVSAQPRYDKLNLLKCWDTPSE